MPGHCLPRALLRSTNCVTWSAMASLAGEALAREAHAYFSLLEPLVGVAIGLVVAPVLRGAEAALASARSLTRLRRPILSAGR